VQMYHYSQGKVLSRFVALVLYVGISDIVHVYWMGIVGNILYIDMCYN
jgi:hypothetical protein